MTTPFGIRRPLRATFDEALVRVPEALKETIKNYFLSLGQENR